MLKPVLALTALLLACSLGFAQTPAPMPQTLRGEAAIAAVSGNTLSGKIDDEENTIYLAPDNRLGLKIDDESSKGKWSARGEKLCLLVEGEDEECFGLEVEAGIAILREDANTAYRLQILQGNARNLPL